MTEKTKYYHIINRIARDSEVKVDDKTEDGKTSNVVIGEFNSSVIEGGSDLIKITGEKLSKEALSIKVFSSEGGEQGQQVKYTVSGNEAEQLVTFDFPHSDREIVYFINIQCGQVKATRKVTVTPKVDNKMIIEGVVCIEEMAKTGGLNLVRVSGTNLQGELIDLKIYKNVQGTLVESQDIASTAKLEYSDENNHNILFSFPANATMVNEEYVLKVMDKNDNSKCIEKKIVVKGNSISKDEMSSELHIVRAYMSENGKDITVEFNMAISNAKDTLELLKNELRINRGNLKPTSDNYLMLGANDSIKLEGEKLIVTLENPIEGVGNSISIKEGAIKDSKGLYNFKIEQWINSYASSLTPFFIGVDTGYKKVFLNEDRKVSFKILGGNLKESLTKIKILDVASTTPLSNIDVVVKGEGDSQVVSFVLPENSSKKTKSYIANISIDGGKMDIFSIISTNELTNPVVLSVLPNGKQITDATIGHMTVHSYGTKIENTDDNTFTITPLLQESKKTRIRVYGTNLVKNITKLKVVDTDNNVQWDVIQDPTKDSWFYFITVAFDGTGIKGSGNQQEIELICPNNMRGDVTYRVYATADGKNFDMNTFVTITVLGQRNENGEAVIGQVRDVRKVVAKYVDEQGKEIAKSEEYTAYDWFKRAYKTEAKIIDGYKFKEIKAGSADETGLIEDFDKEVVYVYTAAVGTETETPVACKDVTSAEFGLSTDKTSVKITLFGGSFKKGEIAANDFEFTGTDAKKLSAGVFTRTSDTVVTITGISDGMGADNTVTVKGEAQATQADMVGIKAL